MEDEGGLVMLFVKLGASFFLASYSTLGVLALKGLNSLTANSALTSHTVLPQYSFSHGSLHENDSPSSKRHLELFGYLVSG